MSVVLPSEFGEDATDDHVKIRLIAAAEEELIANGSGGLQMAAIAKRAGVSRATAFRRLGSLSDVVVLVAIRRAQRYIDAVQQLMAARTGVFSKLEAALIYTARELPTDVSIAAMITEYSATAHDPRVHEAAVGAMGEVVREGRRTGEIRTDIAFDDLIEFLVEQTYLAAEGPDRSEDAVRKRFRQWVIPAVEARGGPGGEIISRMTEIEDAVSAALAAVQGLTGQLLEGQTRDK